MSTVPSRVRLAVLGCVLLACRAAGGGDPPLEPEWPLETTLETTMGNAQLVVYQPQPESLHDGRFTGRVAFSLQEPGAAEPAFGSARISAVLETDRDAREVALRQVEVSDVELPAGEPGGDPGGNEAREREIADLLRDDLPRQPLSMDALLPTLDGAELAATGAEGLRNAPPHIVLATVPTVLVSIDGAPELSALPGTRVMRVVNTAFVILFDPDGKSYWVKAGDDWAQAGELAGSWPIGARPPAAVTAALPAAQVEGTPPGDAPSVRPERIDVVTEPTELIACTGEPRWTPLVGNELMLLANSESDVFLEPGAGEVYALLSGRWFRAPSLGQGPWTYVPSDELPAAFASIPPDSRAGDVRAFVAGTDEAREALEDASIPQTAAVRRDEAHCETTYDGEPRFEPIEGTELRYAVNTDASVLECEGRYYCCQEGVWFVADQPLGPWSVCDHVPAAIYDIPPSCPLYPVRYVYVYDSTPDVVVVGYLPGYLGCYVSGPTIVYGTGWSYRGWHGRHYYARPCTYGFRAVYDPWLCTWGFGFDDGWGTGPGWLAASFGWGSPGWWGHAGFHGRHYHVHDRFVRWNPPHPIHERREVATGVEGHANLYVRPEVSHRNGVRPPARPAVAGPAHLRVSEHRANDVYVDHHGQILRRTESGWQVRRPEGWTPERPPERELERQPERGFERPPERGYERPPGRTQEPYRVRAVPGRAPLLPAVERMHEARMRGAVREAHVRHLVRPQRSAPRERPERPQGGGRPGRRDGGHR